jgi:hypothetical protein
MATRTLIDKIEDLPPEKRAEVEDFVEFLGSRTVRGGKVKRTFPDQLLRAINEDREELRRTKGLFDTQPLIWEFRETGGR